ncbi:glucose-6-phosphate isomerase [Sporosarcina sp. NCCP-2716]|uniref:glucose-6-phosphate isomerase n=1 Tax=Sporosarcina sp. NCCP-2716 TaxID=2943679 RepID=UPI00203C83FD|nr:glucose-6-phosphate isomerase [Sporosarcina sp. NCCP-2716]GKV70174.1 glucose-6-phosphate isomerase [Sporosarcina sp. NCCP-2716]
MPITFDDTNARPFIGRGAVDAFTEPVAAAHARLHAVPDDEQVLGWVDWPKNYDRQEFAHIQTAAERIRKQSHALVVIGIGGSYLGAKAAIEALGHTFRNQADGEMEIYFAGHNTSARYLIDLLDVLRGKEVSVNVISKSGTTTEPALAFRILREYMENRYGEEEARKRIYVTTDAEEGALLQLSDEKGYETFVIPADIGGRYSVLTPVGLLPMAVAGLDIEAMMAGALAACERYGIGNLAENPCYQYAVWRNLLHADGKSIELLAVYDPALEYVAEWWKQLFGESEGKEGKGLFPASVTFTTDLHAIGQYIQQGPELFIETVLQVTKPSVDWTIGEDPANLDGLNFLSGQTLNEVNEQASRGATLAHVDGGVPNMRIEMEELDEFNFGELIYFFEKACAMSGLLLGVNPFDQPGVEAYKRNMFALLGKEGFERERANLQARMQAANLE